MIAELLLTTALTFTGGVAVNDSPQNMLEGVSGCDAYTLTDEKLECVDRVWLAWGGEVRVTGYDTPTAYAAPVAPQLTWDQRDYGDTPESVQQDKYAPEVIENPAPGSYATGITPSEWVAPAWCDDDTAEPEDLGYSDWEYVTESWSDEQVDECFPATAPVYDDGSPIEWKE